MTLETGVKALAEAVAVDVKALEDGKVDKVAGKGLSDTNYTQAEKDKLSSLESSKFVGLFVSESALPLTGSDGDYANVDGGIGSDVYRVVWDSSDNKWVRVQGVSTELTDAQIKQQYESNPDTNAFTDDEKSKLTSVANGATANRADSENADKVHTHTTAQVTGLGTAATKDVGLSTGQVMQVGAFGVGHTFTGQAFDANAIADLADHKSGFYPYVSNTGSTNIPYSYVYIQQLFHDDGNLTQIAYGYNTTEVWVRHRYSGDWSAWVKQLSTVDILQTTGSSTEFPMSQAAITSALSGKAALRATSNIDGGVRMRLDGTTLYITNDGSDA